MDRPARHILHADFDAFYTSVEQRDRPPLRGKPVVVGGDPESRGVVASASYEARRYGIRSAMPMRTAVQRCPQLIRIPPRFDRYGEVSRQVMGIFREITDLVEPLSLDEAYLDVTSSVSAVRTAVDIAYGLKRRVDSELGLTISVGVASSKSVAKIASDMEKPDGLTVVPAGLEREFLAPLEVGKLWGIGPKSAARLAREGIHTIGELASQPAGWFQASFGRTGEHLRELALGLDDQPVEINRDRKSVSAETTLGRDTGDPQVLSQLVHELSQRVARDLSRRELRGRTVKVKLRLADFTTFTRQRTVTEPVQTAEEIAEAAGTLLGAELQADRLFRLVGVGVSGFRQEVTEEPLQPRLTGLD